MRVIAFDTETSLIRPGQMAPPMTCLTWQETDGEGLFSSQIYLHSEAHALLLDWLSDPETLFVGHNVAFDMAVVCAEFPDLIPLVFAAYEADRITDTMLRQKLIDIGHGQYRGYYASDTEWVKLDYSLAFCAKRLANMPIKKEGFRLFYGPFRGVPLDQWVAYAKQLQARAACYRPGNDDDLDYLRACLGDNKKFATELKGMIAARPEEVISYPLEDAEATMSCFLAQEENSDLLEDQYRQARKAWCLHLTSAWGLRTNAPGVTVLQANTQKQIAKIEQTLIDSGLVRPDGTRDTKLAKERMLAACGWTWNEGLGKYEAEEGARPLRLSPAGEPSLDADACKASEDELLKAYAELTSLKSVLNKDIPALARGVIFPVHTRFDLAETGRVTSSSPNVQNWRRLPGIRECFVPRPGYVFSQADYSSLELCTLAQACLDLLGESKLAEALNSGIDPHTALACTILGISYEEGLRRRKLSAQAEVKEGLRIRRDEFRDPAEGDLGLAGFAMYEQYIDFENARQTAKVANFGFPGGLGPAKLVLFARKSYGVELTPERAKELKVQWLAQWPEMRAYFNYVNNLQGAGGVITLTQLRSRRVRTCAVPGAYTAACNSFFQGLGADATAAAYWLVVKACYVDRSSPLFGSRVVNYVHDEFIVESPASRAAECAEELSRLMIQGASEWIPDVKLAAEPCLMAVWSKDAKTLRDERGRLVAWSPANSLAA